MYLLILYLPLINFLLISLFGRFVGNKGSFWIANINMSLLTFISYYIFYETVILGSVCFLQLFSWFNIGLFNISWGFLFDPITGVMLIVVNTISLLVHFYSIGYMYNDPFSSRFISYLSLFTWFMLILVTADNMLQVFLGWEGVGLVSYLLINFWFTIEEANKAAIKAIIMNRIGDIGLGLGICLIYLEYKTLKFSIIFALSDVFKFDYLYFINNYINVISLLAIFILIGAMGKSAQLGLHTWLPDAMAGPTPVSALIHAATMVTAGVFILIRLSPILEYSSLGLWCITLIGVLTAFFAATIGLFQNDIKKIIAYSTCSQLGYMIFICGLSNYSLSLFHLTNHAFFKALLFLSAGAIIHSLSDEQDIRKYGGLIAVLPYSYIMMIIGSLALMGIPFLTGFYSKDMIIEVAYTSYLIDNVFIYWLSVIAALFTSLYSLRLLIYIFITLPNGFKRSYEVLHESNFFMSLPLFILAINSIFFGYINKDLFIGLGTDTWMNWIIVRSTSNILIIESEFLPWYIKNVPFFFSFCGIFIIFIINYYYKYYYKFLMCNNYLYFKSYKMIFTFFYCKWFIDIIYNKIILGIFIKFSYCLFKIIDRGIIELMGPLGIVRSLHRLSKLYNLYFSTGYIFNYLFLFIFSLSIMLLSLFIVPVGHFSIDIIYLYLYLIFIYKY